MYIFQKKPSSLNTVHGFEQLGDNPSPYTLRGGEENREKAEAIHKNRPDVDQQEDENSNEPITLEMETWENNLWEKDFPYVDTIPHVKLLDRATRVLEFAERYGCLNQSELDGDIDENGVLGYFDPVPKRIVVDTDPDDFLGARKGPTVAHELGHAFDFDIGQKSERAGYDESKESVFDTDGARKDAIRLSERLRGSIPEGEGKYSSYRLSEEELLADTFALMVIEPEAAERVGPRAVDCLNNYLSVVAEDIFE
jgi:hypothetical protein